jgi:quinohemoprotein ethanol dehydrogenase
MLPAMLAAIRPAGQDLPVLLHIVGATVVFGGLLASAASLALARGQTRLLRLGYFSLLFVCLPGMALMWGAGEWAYHKQGWQHLPSNLRNPDWLTIGFVVGDYGGLFFIAALIVGGVGIMRLRNGKSDGGLLKVTLGMALLLAVAYVVAVWAMTGKPTGNQGAAAAGPGANAANSTAVHVSATEFKFTLSRQTVPAGEVVFTVVNAGKISHNFSIAGHTSAIVAPGKTTTLTVRLGNRSYPYLCTLPGHAQAGMKGTLRVGTGPAASAPQKVPSGPHVPALTAEQLNTSPGANWPTVAGDLKNDRYSTLTNITKANVSTLKQVWHIHLGTCLTHDQRCGSYEGNAVVWNGIYYISGPKSDVFALKAATGATLWKYTPTLDRGFPKDSVQRQPGVAIGNGLVFIGQVDGYLTALDQKTGKVVWKVQEIPWQKGGHLASAPLYYNGMVIEGTSGGDQGSISNDMEAFDATNGHRLWAWSIVPAPGQPGSNTWTSSDTHYGGGAMWETPAIDPKLNLVIFGTGNPVPWNSRGPGKNLYGDSIVALNVYTGQLVWAYQTVHHDLWDSDLPNPPVLFDGMFKVNGKMVNRPALAEITKFGWTWILDRETGQPLEPVKEVKVPVSKAPEVNSWPTQPIPQGPNVIDDPRMQGGSGRLCVNGHQTQTNANVPFAEATAPDGKKYKMGCHFDPYDTTRYTAFPFEEEDWPATSYNPQAGLFITCGVTARAFAFEQIPKASQVAGAAGGVGVAVLITPDTSTSNLGNFSALNTRTNKLAWHQKWGTPCYSGTANTASGLTFVGHIGPGNGRTGRGYLEAVATKTGRSLWRSPPMDAPATAPPVTYSVNGHQYVSILVGGQAHDDPTRPSGLASPDRLRGDSIYTFALPGTPVGKAVAGAAARKPAPGPKAPSPALPQAPNAPGQATAKGHTIVHVGMYEYRFKLTQSTVPAGKVTFVITNNGKLVHNFDITGVHVGKLLSPGKSETWTVKLAPKKYPYLCDVPFHAGYGMTGTLTVKR